MTDDRGRQWFFNLTKGTKQPTPQEERDFIARAQAGDKEAASEFVRRNIPLIVHRVTRGLRRHRAINESPDSLFDNAVNEGSLSLYRAIEGFDLSRGYRFSTYAVWHIDDAIRKVITFDVTMSRPVKTLEKARDNDHFIAHLSAMPENFDVIEDGPAIEDTIGANSKTVLIAMMRAGMSRLSAEERYILTQHYGLETVALTYDEIASRLSCSVEWIRRQENAALRKIYEFIHKEKLEYLRNHAEEE